jgi:two-component system sensor histidine kinase/response regulator
MFDNLHVLVAEDNSINQAVIMGLLDRAGIRTLVVENGREVLETLPRHPEVKLILMDLQMPVMDGRSCTTLLRNNPRFAHLPIVAMSGESLSRKELEQEGFQDSLEKPVDVEKLYRILLKYTAPEEKVDFKAGAKTIPGVDWERGMKRAGENERLFLELLMNFVKEYGSFPSRGIDLIEEQNFPEAQKVFRHRLDAAQTLCLTEIERVTLRLLESLKKWEVRASIQLCQALEERFGELETVLKSQLGELEGPSEPEEFSERRFYAEIPPMEAERS